MPRVRKLTEAARERHREASKRWAAKNRDKTREYKRRWAAANRERLRAQWRRWKAANPAKIYKHHLRYCYGLTDADYERMLVEQDNRCAICLRAFQNTPRAIHVDHDHTTGQVRALLCSSCNRGLGQFKDDIDRMQRAVDYLKRFANKT